MRPAAQLPGEPLSRFAPCLLPDACAPTRSCSIPVKHGPPQTLLCALSAHQPQLICDVVEGSTVREDAASTSVSINTQILHPQLLVNYGVVEDNNPYDKLQLTATIPNSDPLFQAKRAALQPAGLATQQSFALTAAQVPRLFRPPHLILAVPQPREQSSRHSHTWAACHARGASHRSVSQSVLARRIRAAVPTASGFGPESKHHVCSLTESEGSLRRGRGPQSARSVSGKPCAAGLERPGFSADSVWSQRGCLPSSLASNLWPDL